MNTHPVCIIGLGTDFRDLSPSVLGCIEHSDLLVGGRRILDAFPDSRAELLPVKAPLDQVIARVVRAREQGKKVAVLADGDPLFFGIGERMVRELGPESVEIHPGVTVLQEAAARIKTAWQDIPTVSLHGRASLLPLLRAITRSCLTGVFTDQTWSPPAIAQALLDCGARGFTMHIFEALNTDRERVQVLDPGQASSREFDAPNFILLEKTEQPEVPLRIGTPDEAFVHHQGLITKKEIRVLGLSSLEISDEDTVWDIGAGCGSVALEASLLAGQGQVLAVEEDPDRAAQIRENRARTGAYAVQVVNQKAPDCFAALPGPDRIFIGGGMGRNPALLNEALACLRPQGRLVAHFTLLGSLQAGMDTARELDWPFEVSQVMVSRSRPLGRDIRLDPLNPVFILSVGPKHH
jgi:precorrin-6Y C5,15-methyltransferase (decarboxylating)